MAKRAPSHRVRNTRNGDPGAVPSPVPIQWVLLQTTPDADPIASCLFIVVEAGTNVPVLFVRGGKIGPTNKITANYYNLSELAEWVNQGGNLVLRVWFDAPVNVGQTLMVPSWVEEIRGTQGEWLAPFIGPALGPI